ncbi:hypothetical protein [Myxacorys almedinensis]|uniref:PhnA-like protein n=1 Tax=Myxacorys almedinensis A TaxID=2690445 RepID=A0A8J8CLL0_9CYAN|nr:hypothetical protein [Myxacorys almedinensis]NDJ19776.1 hypothetical protein [Myxacorys almedinensis A]
MAYTNRPVSEQAALVQPVADYHDRVRWGPIISGLFVALVSQLILSALGAAIGATTIAGSGAPRTETPDVANAVGIWSIISLLISLFIGSWVMARACGPMNRSTALLNAAILWATTLALSAYLLASGVTGAFGVIAANAGAVANQVIPEGGATVPNVTPPNVTAQQARDIASNTATAGWSFVLGSLLGLVASLIGGAVGARTPRTVQTNDRPVYTEPNR